MAHMRTQIFDAVKDLLAAIPDFSATGKVARGRISPIPSEDLPALTLTWADDDERASIRPFATAAGADGYDRSLPLSVIVHLGDADPETRFDAIAVQVEAAMAAGIELDGKVIELTLASSRFFVDPRTGLPLAAGRLVYTADYKTPAANPEVSAI